MQKQPAAGPQKARRSTQKRASSALLTITLDAQASTCVRRFAESLGHDVRDVATAAILDTLPQALAEWEQSQTDKRVIHDYWIETLRKVKAAKRRRTMKARA